MSFMAVSYKQRQEEQVRAPAHPCQHTSPSSSQFLLVQCGFSMEVERAGSEARTPYQVRPYLAVRQAGREWKGAAGQGVVKGPGVGLMYKDVPQ